MLSLVGSYELPPATIARGVAYKVALSGSHLILAGGYSGMVVLDISDPGIPTLIGSYIDLLWSVEKVEVSGNYAYLVTNISSEFYVIDISDLTMPVEVAEYEPIGSPSSLVAHGDRLYVSEDSYGLEILELYRP